MSWMPLLYKGLTPELLKKAELELNETTQVKDEALKEFRELIRAQKDIICGTEDEYLLRFLRVKKFNVQKSLKVLRNYISLFQKYSGVFTHRLPTQLQNIVDMNLVFLQPYRLPDSSHIAGLRLGLFDKDKGTFEDLIAYVIATGTLLLEHEATQISGGHMILDFTGTTFHHYRMAFSISVLKFAISALQDCVPMRVRGIHILHEPYIAHTLYKLIKLLGTKKLTEKFHFYGDDLSKLHENISKEFLPQWLGGTMSPMDNEELASVFYSYEDVFKKMKKYKIVESKG